SRVPWVRSASSGGYGGGGDEAPGGGAGTKIERAMGRGWGSARHSTVGRGLPGVQGPADGRGVTTAEGAAAGKARPAARESLRSRGTMVDMHPPWRKPCGVGGGTRGRGPSRGRYSKGHGGGKGQWGRRQDDVWSWTMRQPGDSFLRRSVNSPPIVSFLSV